MTVNPEAGEDSARERWAWHVKNLDSWQARLVLVLLARRNTELTREEMAKGLALTEPIVATAVERLRDLKLVGENNRGIYLRDQ